MIRSRREVTWFGQPVTQFKGMLSELRTRLPTFSRQPFGPDGCQNEYLQVIIREPVGDDSRRIPVAAVSPQYELVQHRDVLDWLDGALATIGNDAASLSGTLTLSRYGERMQVRLSLSLFAFDPGDGHPMSLEVQALNSVDKSTALEVSLGWWRQVCSNGMKVQVKGSVSRRIHLVSRTGAPRVVEVLKAQLAVVPAEHKRYRRWLDMPVTLDLVERWADEKVAQVWGLPESNPLHNLSGHSEGGIRCEESNCQAGRGVHGRRCEIAASGKAVRGCQPAASGGSFGLPGPGLRGT